MMYRILNSLGVSYHRREASLIAYISSLLLTFPSTFFFHILKYGENHNSAAGTLRCCLGVGRRGGFILTRLLDQVQISNSTSQSN